MESARAEFLGLGKKTVKIRFFDLFSGFLQIKVNQSRFLKSSVLFFTFSFYGI